jgi:integrase
VIIMAKANSTRITDKFIRSLKPPATGNKVHTDTEVPGFGVRITAASAIAFVLDYRIRGRNRRVTLKSWPEYDASAARELAIDYRKQIGAGIDPLDVKYAETVADPCRDFIDDHAKLKNRHSTLRNYQQQIDRFILPTLGRLAVKVVTRRDIEKLHKSLRQTPYQANRVLAVCSRIFNLAVHWEMIERNPVQGIEKFHEEARERYLKSDELKRLVAALGAFPDRSIASAIALMMLTGCRKSEALQAEWNQFDMQAATWTKPSHHTKQKRVHRVPLNPAAVQLLQTLPRIGPHVFTGRVEGQPLQDIKKAWEMLRLAAQVPDLRMHDLRHSYASILASQNLSLPIIGQFSVILRRRQRSVMRIFWMSHCAMPPTASAR